jgi:hypothetical protein
MWIVLFAFAFGALGSAALWLYRLWSALPRSNRDFEWLEA